MGASKFKIHMIKYPKGYSKKTINAIEFEIYLDSAPHDWLFRLENLKVPCYVSPFHDKDIKEDGTPKKPHYHIVIVFAGGKSESFCQGIIDEVGGANGYGEVVRSIEGSIRYLAHVGYPDKYLYNVDEILTFGGAPLKKYFDDSDIEDVSTVTSVINYIKNKRHILFCDFLDYCIKDKPSWLRALRTIWFQNIVKEYIKSHYERQSQFLRDYSSD